MKRTGRNKGIRRVIIIISLFFAIAGVIACATATNSTELSEGLPPTIIFATIALICGIMQKRNTTDEDEYRDEFCDDPDEIDPHDISIVDGMDGYEFEYFCADILIKNGFSEAIVTKGSGDQGVDILAVKDGIRYAIQCKNYASALSNTPVQEVNAGKTFYGCHVGVVLTNSTFTPGARALAQATGVLLWDRSILQKMIDNSN